MSEPETAVNESVPEDDQPADSTPVTESFEEKNSSEVKDVDEPASDLSNEIYACNRQYVIILAQLLAVHDREKVYKWIEKLDTMNDCEKREERDMYLKFLTLSLNNGKLVQPFNKAPPPGLRPLSTIMPRFVHNHIYKNKYTTGECGPPKDTAVMKYSSPSEVEPRLFFSRQPVPRNGSIVYAAAFCK